jgi:hypothetical protein
MWGPGLSHTLSCMNSFLVYPAVQEHMNDMRRQAAEARIARAARPARNRRIKLGALIPGRRAPKPLGKPATVR